MWPISNSPGGRLTGSVVEELDVDVGLVARGGGPDDSPDALGGAAATADDPTQITGADPHVEAHPAAIGRRVDPHGIGIIDDGRDDVAEDCRGRRRATVLIKSGVLIKAGVLITAGVLIVVVDRLA